MLDARQTFVFETLNMWTAHLIVRSGSEEMAFSMDLTAGAPIYWIAFTSKCVAEVTLATGSLVLLSYTLCIREKTTMTTELSPPIDVRLSWQFQAIRTVLNQPGFFRQGKQGYAFNLGSGRSPA